MCLVKIEFDETGSNRDPVTDVVDVAVDTDGIEVMTLFGERLRFPELFIRRVDLAAATVHLCRRA